MLELPPPQAESPRVTTSPSARTASGLDPLHLSELILNFRAVTLGLRPVGQPKILWNALAGRRVCLMRMRGRTRQSDPNRELHLDSGTKSKVGWVCCTSDPIAHLKPQPQSLQP